MHGGLPDDLVASLLARRWSGTPRDMFPRAPRPAPPLPAAVLDAAERELGLRLPAALRDFYGRVANGGFGPGYGLIGLVGGVRSDANMDVVDEYRLRLRSDEGDPSYFWPVGVLPVCHWGCAIYSCVDCRTPEAAVLRVDPNAVDDDWSAAWGMESPSLAAWLRRWADGEELFCAGTPDGSYVVER